MRCSGVLMLLTLCACGGDRADHECLDDPAAAWLTDAQHVVDGCMWGHMFGISETSNLTLTLDLPDVDQAFERDLTYLGDIGTLVEVMVVQLDRRGPDVDHWTCCDEEDRWRGCAWTGTGGTVSVSLDYQSTGPGNDCGSEIFYDATVEITDLVLTNEKEDTVTVPSLGPLRATIGYSWCCG